MKYTSGFGKLVETLAKKGESRQRKRRRDIFIQRAFVVVLPLTIAIAWLLPDALYDSPDVYIDPIWLQTIGAAIVAVGAGFATFLLRALLISFKDQTQSQKELIRKALSRRPPKVLYLSEGDPPVDPLERVMINTSEAAVTQDEAKREEALRLLSVKVETLSEQVASRQAGVVETRIDPMLEATLAITLENLSKKVEDLDKKTLTKWDVVVVIFALTSFLAAIAALIGAVITYWPR